MKRISRLRRQDENRGRPILRKRGLGFGLLLVILVSSLCLPTRLAHSEGADEELPAEESSGGKDKEALSELENVFNDQEDKTAPVEKKEEAKNEKNDTAIDEMMDGVEKDKEKEVEKPVKTPPPAVAAREKARTELEAVPDKKGPASLDGPQEGSPPSVQGDVSVRNNLTNLEFKTEGQKTRIVVTARNPLVFREVRNTQMKQVVYFFENTETPTRLQRAYDTSEFVSPVALFTLLQMPNEKPPLSKLIVQLREDKYPTVTSGQKGLYIDFPAASGSGEPKLILGDKDAGQTEQNIYASGQTYNGKLIKRLEVKNTDVQDILRLIAKSSGYNIVVGDDVTGKVGTLSLENIPWDQAFTLVLQSKKLGYVRTGNVIRVATLGSLKSEKDEALATEQSRIKVEILRTVLIPISYAKANDLAPRGRPFLTDRGNIDIDTRTNTIIVRDIDVVVNRLQKLFSALDTQPPRVAISAKIVEVGSDLTRAMGFSLLTANTTLGGQPIAFNLANGAGQETVSTVLGPASFAQLNYTLSIGEVDGSVRILANPSVSVVANQQARINQSINFFITTNQFINGTVTPTVQEITANLLLEVTPIVAGDGSIFMTVHAQNDIPQGLGGPSPTIDGRDVNTQVLIENGDTSVIGGVFSNTVTSQKTGFPYLMNIPIIGFFFQRDVVTDRRNEIFVFLTAKVTNAEEAFKRAY